MDKDQLREFFCDKMRKGKEAEVEHSVEESADADRVETQEGLQKPISLSKMIEGHMEKREERIKIDENKKSKMISDIFKKSNMKIIEGIM